ncbi:MAG: GPP34 family phosphoprotein [Solirubrobacterales bacterium]|nr:GPP34 family phosphoprotein [Solirubrobacterales bacterium]MBV9365144.1 GPP34 family phosphoprotein [Solirubrobacterales bacterium]MBV9806209.1 GPP34 family phosphoprotein [Solirubrobacterales bacterium]
MLDDSPTPDATLDGSLAAVRDRSNRERARIESAAMRKLGVGEHYSARLVDAGWFGEAGKRTLVPRRPKVSGRQSGRVGKTKAELYTRLVGDGQLVERDIALVALLAAAGGEHDRGRSSCSGTSCQRPLQKDSIGTRAESASGRARMTMPARFAATMTGATHEVRRLATPSDPPSAR